MGSKFISKKQKTNEILKKSPIYTNTYTQNFGLAGEFWIETSDHLSAKTSSFLDHFWLTFRHSRDYIFRTCRKVHQKWFEKCECFATQTVKCFYSKFTHEAEILCVGVGIDGRFFENFISFLLFGNKFWNPPITRCRYKCAHTVWRLLNNRSVITQ